MTTIFWTRAIEYKVPGPSIQLTGSTSLGTSSRPLRRLLGSTALAFALVFATVGMGSAQAQGGDAEAGAQQLFNQARKLMKAKKYEEACAKFEASENPSA